MARLPLAQLVVLALAALCTARAGRRAVALGPRLALAAGLGLAALVRPVVAGPTACPTSGFVTSTVYSGNDCTTGQKTYITVTPATQACEDYNKANSNGGVFCDTTDTGKVRLESYSTQLPSNYATGVTGFNFFRYGNAGCQMDSLFSAFTINQGLCYQGGCVSCTSTSATIYQYNDDACKDLKETSVKTLNKCFSDTSQTKTAQFTCTGSTAACPTDTLSKTSASNTPLIVGLVVGVGAPLLLGIAGAFYYFKVYKPKQAASLAITPVSGAVAAASGTSPAPGGKSPSSAVAPLELRGVAP